MTQVAQIFEEEKQQAVQQAVQQALVQASKDFEEEKKQLAGNTSKKVVIRMIKMNYPTEEIVSVMPDYSMEDVEKIRKEAACGSEI